MSELASNYTYAVASRKPWNQRVFNEVIAKYPGNWLFANEPEALDSILSQCDPRYIFFLHWSWTVPNEIINRYECIAFHMADVPHGRGGSPLQNLIGIGHHCTKLAALRMVQELDAGPVYAKEDLSLEGNAEEIYIRAAYLSAKMIRSIIDDCPEPIPQQGEPTVFTRRNASDSRIPEMPSLPLPSLYDFIRMLDAEGYPHAFLEYGGFRFELRRAALYDGRIVADVTITSLEAKRK